MKASPCSELCDYYRAEIGILLQASFQDFLSALKEIVNNGVSTASFKKRMPNASDLALYMMETKNTDGVNSYWGFPCTDIRSFLRALLEVVPDATPVTQDLTDLVNNGYYDRNAPVSKLALQELKGNYSINSPVIVLTEGRTDSETLRLALDVLYPHLTEYYSFMDLAVRSPGGAGSLVHVIKSFAGAGIENRVIAFFDNDTAGRCTASTLHGIQLPSTVRLLYYPDIELATQYPTIGPTGTSIHNVNGAACSIELFFGRDVLVNGGSFTPVQWKAFDPRLKQWQGEVQNKDELKDRFFTKVKRAKESPEVLSSQDWGDMRHLLNTMFDAFNT